MYIDIPQIKSDLEVGTLGYYEYRSCLICAFGGLSNNKVLNMLRRMILVKIKSKLKKSDY